MAKQAIVEPPTSKAAVLELTKKQKEDGNKRYWKLVEETRAEEENAFRVVLMSHWKRGQRVASLLNDPKKYGNNTAENFGKDIRPDKPYSQHEVRRWHRFFQQYTLDEVEGAINQKIPWRAVHSLIGEPDKKRRVELQKQLASGKITSDDVKSIIKKSNLKRRDDATKSPTGKKNTERRGGVATATIYRTFHGFINDFGNKLDEFTEACKRHDKAPEGAESSLADQRRKDCVKGMKSLVAKFDRAIKAGDK